MLIIRLSSIGDIVVCTPVIRCIKKQVGCEVHFMVKDKFRDVLKANPYIDEIISYDKADTATLKKQGYDIIIDLHKNLRTQRLKLALGVPNISYDKLNIEKWFLTQFHVDKLPKIHLVDRYFIAMKKLGVVNDNEGLDFFVDDEYAIGDGDHPYIAIVIGAAHFTKQIPSKLCRDIIADSSDNFVLLGGKDEIAKSKEIAGAKNCINLVGKINLSQSASVVRDAQVVITGDTGLMHIAAALKKPLITVWGSTAPALGMYPYYGNNQQIEKRIEIKSLKCRPCTKIGKASCPKGHFDCMTKISSNSVLLAMNEVLLRN